jgi:hypothetical protein
MSIHPLITFFVDSGVPLQTVALLLFLPIVATLVALFRQIIGIKAFGIYTPSIITFALLAFDPNGVKYGIAIFIAVIVVGMLSRWFLKRFRLLYLPRVAITLSIVSLKRRWFFAHTPLRLRYQIRRSNRSNTRLLDAHLTDLDYKRRLPTHHSQYFRAHQDGNTPSRTKGSD